MEWNVWIYQSIYTDKAVSSLLKSGIAFDDPEIIPHLGLENHDYCRRQQTVILWYLINLQLFIHVDFKCWWTE